MNSPKSARMKHGHAASGLAGIVCVITAVFLFVSCEQPGGSKPKVPVISITVQPADLSVTEDNISGSLDVSAYATESAALSYQWYENQSGGNSSGSKKAGATEMSFTIPGNLAPGTYYYFCEVSASRAVPVRSVAAKVTINPKDTKIPVISITTEPVDLSVTEGSTGSLSVSASATEGATPAYQWYKNTIDSNSGGTIINGAISANFTIPTDLPLGAYYYYCEVSATNAATVRSEAATVTVLASGTVMPVIDITTEPADLSVTEDNISGSLSVTASATPSATLTYQWYSNTIDSYSGGTEIDGATEMSFTIPPDLEPGAYYYYCEVSATNAATVRSEAAKVTVNASDTVTPLIPDTWADGDIPTEDGEQWFSFTATADTQFIHARFGTLSYLYVQLYDSNGNTVGGRTSLYSSTTFISRSVNPGETYYIKVTPWSVGVSGTYEIRFTTTFVPPELSPSELTFDTWKDGNIPTSNGEEWFTFRATAATQYIHARFGTLSYLDVQLYNSNGNTVGGSTMLYSSTKYISRSVNPDEIYYIKVTPLGSSSSGNYRILFNTSPVPEITIITQPSDITVTAGKITGSLTVGAEVTADAELYYQWYNSESGPIDGAASTSYTIPADLIAGTYSYYCEVSASDGAVSKTSNTATVTVNESADVKFVIQLSYMDEPNLIEQYAFAVAGTDTLFTVSGTGYTEYVWYLNGEKDESATTPTYTFNRNAGSCELTVVVSNAAGKYSGRCHVTVR